MLSGISNALSANAAFSELQIVGTSSHQSDLTLSTLLPNSIKFVLSLKSVPGVPRLTLACRWMAYIRGVLLEDDTLIYILSTVAFVL